MKLVHKSLTSFIFLIAGSSKKERVTSFCLNEATLCYEREIGGRQKENVPGDLDGEDGPTQNKVVYRDRRIGTDNYFAVKNQPQG